ncbi:MAG: hypothetical protein EXQ95_07935 [Alphaproteobacteria bacterium]|nr:hypothetical protein [Alphaproteobacteria bacterium]
MKWSVRSAAMVAFVSISWASFACAGEKLVIGGTGWSIGISKVMVEAFLKREPGVEIEVPRSVGSGGGLRALRARDFQVGFSTRPPSDEDKAAGLVATHWFRTPLILALSEKVRGDVDLGDADVKAVFAQEIKAWPDGTPARPVIRSERETEVRLMIEHFPGIEPIFNSARTRRGVLIARSDQEAMDLAETVTGALAATTLVAVRSERRQLKPVAINGIVPSIETMNAGTYRITVDLYAVLGTHSGEAARRFVGFLTSAEGARILGDYGAYSASAAR